MRRDVERIPVEGAHADLIAQLQRAAVALHEAALDIPTVSFGSDATDPDASEWMTPPRDAIEDPDAAFMALGAECAALK